MALFTSINIPTIADEKELPSKTYAVDFESGHIIGTVDSLDAVKQFITKALITSRFHNLIYTAQYGSEIRDRVNTRDASREYIESELPRVIEDALLCDGRIKNVYDFSFSFEEDFCNVGFSVDTVFGNTKLEVKI